MINLKKGGGISLEKDGVGLLDVTIGVNWAKIQDDLGKWTLGLLGKNESVDLDGSVALFDENKKFLEVVYFRNLISSDGAVVHSGDDRSGDFFADDLDNETITINLSKINKNVAKMVFFLNSYKKQDFNTIPYSKIRIYEGGKARKGSMLATFDLSSDPLFDGKISMIMGKIAKNAGGKWNFVAVGEPSYGYDVKTTVDDIYNRFLD